MQLDTDKLSPFQQQVYKRLLEGLQSPDCAAIPHYMHDGLILYFVKGYEAGGFLTALLENDFMLAVGKADDQNQQALVAYAKLFYNWTPMGSYGSPEKVEKWIAEMVKESKQGEAA